MFLTKKINTSCFGATEIFNLVDEAQDIGYDSSVLSESVSLKWHPYCVIGDPRQTLYEFRHALSEWVFEQKLYQYYLVDTNVQTRITPASTNDKLPKPSEILQFAEMVSERMVTYAQYERPEEAKYIDIIHDPKESVRPNECFIPQDSFS